MDACSGLVAGAVAERLGGLGTACIAYPGESRHPCNPPPSPSPPLPCSLAPVGPPPNMSTIALAQHLWHLARSSSKAWNEETNCKEITCKEGSTERVLLSSGRTLLVDAS